jgi:hypothetical protein
VKDAIWKLNHGCASYLHVLNIEIAPIGVKNHNPNWQDMVIIGHPDIEEDVDWNETKCGYDGAF